MIELTNPLECEQKCEENFFLIQKSHLRMFMDLKSALKNAQKF